MIFIENQKQEFSFKKKYRKILFLFRKGKIKVDIKNMGMTQRPWTPTKRRGPIAAEYNSPGPACVTLPPLIGN